MNKSSILKNSLKRIKTLTQNFKVFEVKEKISPKTFQVRRLSSSYPFYFVLLSKPEISESSIYICVPFTEDIELAFINQNTPLLKINKQKVLLVGLPFWIYLTEEFLRNHSQVIINNLDEKSINKIKQYLDEISFDKIKGVNKEYLELMMKLLSPLNTENILVALDEIEAYWEEPQVIKLSEKDLKQIEETFFPELKK